MVAWIANNYQHYLLWLDYFGERAKFISHCLNFGKCFVGGSQFFDLHMAKW